MTALPLDRPLIGITYSSAELADFLLWRSMFRGVVAAGGIPLAIDCRHPLPDLADLADLVGRLDGLVVSGGGDVDARRYGASPDDPLLRGVNPHRDESELAALDAALDRRLPVLAICRGAQLVNVARGGTLYVDLGRDLPSELRHRESEEALGEPLHDVDVVAGTTLAAWTGGGTIGVNSQHHQGIRTLAAGLVPSAHAPDGLIEAYEDPAARLVAIQWHPEVLWPVAEHALGLLRGFVAECGAPAAGAAGAAAG
ncbi:gamma-glutamyl-gamma-aminobutyrate hydrolase family protein [Nocardioides sp. WV_118_6]